MSSRWSRRRRATSDPRPTRRQPTDDAERNHFRRCRHPTAIGGRNCFRFRRQRERKDGVVWRPRSGWASASAAGSVAMAASRSLCCKRHVNQDSMQVGEVLQQRQTTRYLQTRRFIHSFIHSFARQVTHVQHLVKTYCKMSWTTRQTSLTVVHDLKKKK